MNKTIKMFLIILIIVLIICFLIQFIYKNKKDGNTIIKSENDLIEYILNISSYEAKLEVTINSNKTSNKYILEQYYMKPDYFKQVVKEPSNIENLEIIYSERNLEVKNTNLGLSKIYENYSHLNENRLWLVLFIDSCRNDGYKIEDNEKEIILLSKLREYKGKLHINKTTCMPTKLEVLDNDNKSKIYIEYKEIKLNNIQENNIFAFEFKNINKEV